MTAVAAVLRAETNDLRELASIGGADPTTLFVGTSMVGVDIRGQDLRGMTFSNLDPATVLMDETTQIDGAVGAESGADGVDAPTHAPAEKRALVFFAGQMQPSDELYRLRDVQLFWAGEESFFLSACEEMSGPRIVVFAPDEVRSGFDVLSVMPGRALGLDTRISGAGGESSDIAAWERRDKAVVLTAVGPDAAYRVRDRILALEETIDYLISSWGDAERMMHWLSQPLLLVARPNAPNFETDGLLQLDERLRLARVRPTRGAILMAERPFEVTVDGDVPTLGLFPDLQLRSSSTLSRTGVVLWCDYERIDLETSAFHSEAVRILDSLGWQLQVPGLAEDQHSSVDLVGEHVRIALRFEEQGLAPPDEALRGLARTFHFAEVRAVVVCSAVEPSLAVSKLLGERELWVTLRDLGAFPGQSQSLWILVASQLRRFARGGLSSLSATRYFELLLRAILNNGGGDRLIHIGRLARALNLDEFTDHYAIFVESTMTSDASYEFRLALRPRGTGVAPALAVEVGIGAQGARFLTIEPITAEA